MNKYQESVKSLIELAEEIESRFNLTPSGILYDNLTRETDILKEALDKAEKYDQLTEQLGCPVEVVMEALKQDYIYIGKQQKQISISLYLDDDGDFAFDGEYKLKNYKKSWWTREDLSE